METCNKVRENTIRSGREPNKVWPTPASHIFRFVRKRRHRFTMSDRELFRRRRARAKGKEKQKKRSEKRRADNVASFIRAVLWGHRCPSRHPLCWLHPDREPQLLNPFFHFALSPLFSFFSRLAPTGISERDGEVNERHRGGRMTRQVGVPVLASRLSL